MTKTDEQSIIEANNLFAVDLYASLARERENLFISPFSILTALYMAYAGARGKTAAQIESALHITIPQERFHQAFNRFSGLLDVSEGYELAIANALSMKVKRDILDSYKNLIKSVYRSEFLEFSADVINAWVSKQSRGHINKIVGDLKTKQVEVALGSITEQLVRDLTGGVGLKAYPEGGVGDRQLRIIAAVVA